jgi:hypothetical protein
MNAFLYGVPAAESVLRIFRRGIFPALLSFCVVFSIIMQGYLVEQICQNESAVQISTPYFSLKTNLLYELAQDMLTITLMA